jgi:ferric-dicitrate binding protein FerR (iron transport regulator)
MNITDDRIEGLLLRYITGELSGDEEKEVEAWSDLSQENAKTLAQAWFVWQCGEKLRIMNSVDPAPALQRFKKR